jgi:hypothetical protein
MGRSDDFKYGCGGQSIASDRSGGVRGGAADSGVW